MTCKKYEGKINDQDFTAFICDMGIKKIPKEDYDRLLQGNKSLLDKNKKLEAENKRLREALEFYADKSNWEMSDCGYDCMTIDGDGKIAREALK